MLLVASIIALVALVWVLRWFPASFFSRVGSGLVLGGAASNLLDRLFIGAVTDYLDFPSWWVLSRRRRYASRCGGADVLSF